MLKIPYALWAYKKSIRNYVGALIYGDEAIVPLNLEIPSLDVSLDGLIPNEDKRKANLSQLDFVDEKKLIL